MKRILFKELENWRNSKQRKPLILLGARQVGKTFLLKEFGAESFPATIYVNFEAEPHLDSLFKESLHPMNIIKNLQVYYNTLIDPNSTLIIFDEVQESAEALTSLKYFCEDAPEYFIVAAGSLLGLKTKRSKGFPVGKVKFLSLYPMSFFEYLQAMNELQLLHHLQSIQSIEPLPEALHQRCLELFKIYLYIGGMPEVVKTYVEQNNLANVRNIQLDIIKAYEFDFAKHAPTELIKRISEVWHALPKNLAKEHKKFVFSAIRQGARAREYDAAIQWLLDAGLAYRAQNILTPKLPLPAYTDHHAFKLFMNDVGLLGALSKLDSRTLLSGNELFNEFKGALIENFIAGYFAAFNDNKLYYWTSTNTAEVDFIMQYENKLYPVEVKSGQTSKKKSLLVYKERYHPKKLYRISPMNLRQDGQIINCPLYLAERFLNFLC